MAAKILFAEDDPLLRQLYQHYIERAGYECVEASNGREAIAAVERENPQLAVMDMLTPDMDGLEVLLALRRSPTTRMIPAILMTDQSNYYRASIIEFTGKAMLLTKPVGPNQLLDAIRRLLSGNVQA